MVRPLGPRGQTNGGIRSIAPMARFPQQQYQPRSIARPNQNFQYKTNVRNPIPGMDRKLTLLK